MPVCSFTDQHREPDINADDQPDETDYYHWVQSYAEAVARHFDDPAPLLRSHAAGLDIHAASLDQRAARIREFAQAFRDAAEFDRRTT